MLNDTMLSLARIPDAFHALTALRHVTCGCTLFQELVWTCSPHMNGLFMEYKQHSHACLPVSGELIAVYYQRVQYLSREIELSRDVSGMQHELLRHVVNILSQNGDSGLTCMLLLSRILAIKQAHRTPSSTSILSPFSYHEVITCLHDAEITRRVCLLKLEIPRKETM
jgi:hypothetical protein